MATDIDPDEEDKLLDEEEEQKRLEEEEMRLAQEADLAARNEEYDYIFGSDAPPSEDELEDFRNRDFFDEVFSGLRYPSDDYPDETSGSTDYEDMTQEERDAHDALFGGAYPGTNYEDEANTDVVDPDYTKSKRNPPKRGLGGVNIGNTRVPMGPLLAGGAALTIGNNDDEETTVPLPINENNDDMTDPTTTNPTYQLDEFGRIIPNSMAEGGTLQEVGEFGDAYENIIPGFTQNMANVTGAGQSAFARSVLGMEGDDISALDIARETSRQQRGSLNEALGLADDASYQEMVDAGTSGMRGLNQVRDTVLPGLQSAFQESEQRLEQGLSGRQLQNVEQQARARFGNRVRDNAGFVGEVTDIASEDAGLYSRNLQDLLGISQTTSNLGQQEAYAMSPFTGAAISSSDLGPGLALAGDIGQQASAATPSPTDIFGLEAGERQFSLGQEALNAAGETGNITALTALLGAGGSFFGGGPNAGLVQNPATNNNRGYTGQGVQNNQYRFF
jgi:hypothetical protein|tara:strand:+ start:43 stop:1554 length:1512 start_codon:yes stop_codon:yes gene_type:complete